MTLAIASHDHRFLNFVHVICGVLWTGIDLFMGFVIGPILRKVGMSVLGRGGAHPSSLVVLMTIQGVSVAFDNAAVGCPGCGNLRSRNRQHVWIDIDGNDVPDQQGKRCSEEAVTTTEVNHFHVWSNS